MTAPSRGRTAAELLSVGQMGRADAATIKGGVPGIELMETAGAAVAERAAALFSGRPVAVLCGPGNNGGDGFVAARLLKERGAEVRLYLLGDVAKLGGDAALAAGRWSGGAEPLTPGFDPAGAAVIDALFGAGLTRPLEGTAAAVAGSLNGADAAVLAVDIPSGVTGDTGAVGGAAIKARETVTFCRRKPGHFLMPGAAYCGAVRVADIGIPDAVVAAQNPDTWVNSADLWWPDFPHPGPEDHKYSRGHVVVWGSAAMPGAARMAADGGRRAGAGIVSIACLPDDAAVFRTGAPGVLVRPLAGTAAYAEYLEGRVTALVVGPGNGPGPDTRRRVLAALAAGKPLVLDADGLSAFADDPAPLLAALHGNCVITPHEGEFARIFPGEGDRLGRARRAAEASGAVVLLKGFDTVVAAPDGRAAINANGTPHLATAGTGDVLAGMAAGLLAQGMDPFTGAAAAVWLHAAAARCVGHGLIAEDIPALLPAVIRSLPSALAAGAPGHIFSHLPLEPSGKSEQF
ncbi:MAG: bifunctional ADP-dependent NAD(P)H-hydrate dehydratase/NAD(P)H-hydrate epimerase [Rhodospirillales bacterium CG15_BIG_FIL_POST_REV_8_21_14_020_66_15]|nr:MAG: bifunctional ADP-dependent NAD(P)H-hydrate dehydratase/NAD(P)H-hydrate epimerase [Rhodospirillales bacterium CG15_BIG_FIL_POST_REV_8_21_14_020_66_15]